MTRSVSFVLSPVFAISLFFLVAGSAFSDASAFGVSRVAASETTSAASVSVRFFQPVSLVCEGRDLRAAAARFSEVCDADFFVDRRVDPGTLVSGSFSNEPALDAFRKTLESAELSCCRVSDSLVWIGPKDAAGELLLLIALKREERRSLPPKVAEKLDEPLDFSIPNFGEPRDVFQSLSRRLRVKFVGFDKTPFDRWRAAKFRSVAPSDLTSILLFGFNVDYRWDPDANALKPISLDRSRPVERTYSSAVARNLDRRSFANVAFSTDSDSGAIVVSGPFSDVAKVEYAVSLLENDAARRSADSNRSADAAVDSRSKTARRTGGSSDKSGVRKEVSGVIADKKLRDAFAYFEKNVGLTFELDASLTDAGVSLDDRISCEFRAADEREIAATIARKIGAFYRIDGNRVVFSAKKP